MVPFSVNKPVSREQAQDFLSQQPDDHCRSRDRLATAVCSSAGAVVNFTICGGRHSFDCTVSGDIGSMAPSFKGEWRGFHQITTAVPCRPLAELMRSAGLERAAFLSLDVEGAELNST